MYLLAFVLMRYAVAVTQDFERVWEKLIPVSSSEPKNILQEVAALNIDPGDNLMSV